jgi:hypothetical protein
MVYGRKGWVDARWTRRDNSRGSATLRMSLKTSERWYVAELHLVAPTAATLRDLPLARIEAAVNANDAILDWVKQGVGEETMERARVARSRRPKLTAPNGRPDDAYFEYLAECYRAAVAAGLPPAKTLAEESGTPPGTLARWIRKARDAGYLGDAEPGRVTT